MAAPEFVPVNPAARVRAYTSPHHVPAAWTQDRPAEVADQPGGPIFGVQGPDQGYALVLARRFEDRLVLADGEHHEDVIAGCLGVALKRASLFGRAPVVHDWDVALTVWGFLSVAPPELVAFREPIFAELREPHHTADRRAVVDHTRADVLRQAPAQAREAVSADWRAGLVIGG